ncbi:MAG: hypothetical protein WDM78_19795 [Puia sp.]
MRGADRYPILIRKFEPRPIKIFLQDGSNDLNIYAGDWWMANQTMERALIFSGYQVNHVWGEGQHNGKQGTSIFPGSYALALEGMAKSHGSGRYKKPNAQRYLIPGEDWKLVGQIYKFTEGTAINEKGEVFFQDIPNSKTYKVDLDGKLTDLNINAKRASGTSFGPDGRRYTSLAQQNK